MKFNWFIWIPRILLIIFSLSLIIYTYILSVGPQPFINKLEYFLLHVIPAIAWLLILWLTWKKPQWCGFLIILVSFIFTILYRTYALFINLAFISIAPFLIGILYVFVNYKQPKVKETQKAETIPLPKQ
jgi:hypothetical protein